METCWITISKKKEQIYVHRDVVYSRDFYLFTTSQTHCILNYSLTQNMCELKPSETYVKLHRNGKVKV